MLSVKSDNKKNIIYIAIIGAVILIVAVVLYFFYFKSDDAENATAGSVVTVKRIEVKKINIDIFNYDNFTNLQDYSSYYDNIESSVPGNKEPFMSQK